MTVQAENKLDQDLWVDHVDPATGLVASTRLPRASTIVLDGIGYADLTETARTVMAARRRYVVTDFETRGRLKHPVHYVTTGAVARVAGVAVVSGDVGTRKVVTGTVSGSGGVAGTLARAARVSGLVGGAQAVTAAPRAGAAVSGSAAGNGSLLGGVSARPAVAGLVAGAQSLSGDMPASAANDIHGTVAGSGVVSAALSAAVRTAGTVTGSGALTGTMPVTNGDVLPVTHNLVLRLAATAIAGASDGDTIATWSDISGAGNHATSGNGVYKVNQLNGKPVIHFDGTMRYTLPNIPQAIPMHVFMVMRTTDGSSRYQEVLSRAYVNNEPALYASAPGAPYASSFYWDGPAGLNTQSFAGLGYPHTGFRLSRWSFTGSAVEIREQGGLTTIVTSASNVANWTAVAGQLGFSQQFVGDIAEILIYNTALTTQERQDIEAYLYHKYGFDQIGSAEIGASLRIG